MDSVCVLMWYWCDCCRSAEVEVAQEDDDRYNINREFLSDGHGLISQCATLMTGRFFFDRIDWQDRDIRTADFILEIVINR